VIVVLTDFQEKDLKTVLNLETNEKPIQFVDLRLPIADMEKPLKEEIPEQYKAISKYNVKTDKETVGLGGPREVTQVIKTKKKQKKKDIQKPAPQKSKPASSKSKKQNTQKKNLPEKSPLAVKKEPENNLQDTLARLNQKQKQDEQNLQKLFESQSDPEYKISFSRGGDFLPNYKVGGRTYVNAIAHPNVAYYAEIKRKFRYAWDPYPVLRGKSHLFSKGIIRTVWGFTIDQKGRIVDMKLIKASPNEAYDSEARRTILASAPFFTTTISAS
jgi:outer membrane biosynthesis protein TonB